MTKFDEVREEALEALLEAVREIRAALEALHRAAFVLQQPEKGEHE